MVAAEPNQALHRYLLSQGLPESLLIGSDEDLTSMGLALAMQPGVPTLTMKDLAQQSGLPITEVTRLRLAMGLPTMGANEPVGSDQDLELYITLREATVVFGREPVLSLVQVIGTALATIADAATSSFLVNVDFPQRDPISLANVTSPESIQIASTFVTRLSAAINVILRRHLLEARRTTDIRVSQGFEQQTTAVGFVDLVGSTALAEDLSLTDLGDLLGEFESIARSTVTKHGARTVKLIGDEVMFAAADPSVVIKIGSEIVRAVQTSPNLPEVRVGIASGDTLHRDGDLFGPTVNLAARLAKHAYPGSVLISQRVADSLTSSFAVSHTIEVSLAGIREPVVASFVDLAACEPATNARTNDD